MTQEDLFSTPDELAILAEPEVLEAEAEAVEPVAETVEAPVAETVEPVAPPSVEPQLATQAVAVIAQLDAQRDALAEKYETGEISFKDYRAQERVLERQQREAEAVVQQAEADVQGYQREWSAAVSDFRKDPTNAVFESPVGLPLMESAIAAIRAHNPGIGASQQLQQAKTMVQEQLRQMMGLSTLPVTPVAQRTRQLPPSLGGVPVAEANESSIEFAHLDKLDGLRLEKAIAKLNPDQRERWLMAS